MLRLDAERFGTAEYYEATRDGGRPRVRRRLAWYGLGDRHRPRDHRTSTRPPSATLFLGRGDRSGPCSAARVRVARDAQAVGVRDAPLPPASASPRRSYPGALLNSTATAFIDEAAFRGAIFGLAARRSGWTPNVANVDPGAPLRADHPARGARARPLPAGPDPRHRAHRRLADGGDRRHRAPRSWAMRSPASRCSCPRATPGETRRAAASSRRSRAPPAARRLAGHRVAGVRRSRDAVSTPSRRAPLDRCWPPVALYVHVPFCVSLCPYCDFVVLAGRRGTRAAQPSRQFVDGAR